MADFLVGFWVESTEREAGQKVLLHAKVVQGTDAQAAVDAAVFDDQYRPPHLVGTPVITALPIYTVTP